MDPNETLAVIRRITSQVLNTDLTTTEVSDLLWNLAESVNDLDGWLSRGGFLPDTWKR